MPKANKHFQDERQDPITPLEAYDPVYWRERARTARQRASKATASEAAAFKREATDYERLAEYAAAVRVAGYAA